MIQVRDSELLKEQILKNGFSYRILAEKVGCSQTHISLILNGIRNPSAKIAKKICTILKLNFDDIFFIFYDYKSKREVCE